MTDSHYCPQCGTQCQISDQFCKGCGNSLKARTAEQVSISTLGTATSSSEKSAVAALFLCMFLGYFGIHRFYTGKIGTGILMLLTLGGVGIWTLIDIIVIACSKFKDKHGRYLEFKSSDPATQSRKSGNTTLLLSLFLGTLGIHRFYVGKIGTGILMLFTFGGLGIWAMIDVIVIACGNFKDKSGQYLNFDREMAPSSKSVLTVALITVIAFSTFIGLIIFTALWATSGLTDTARHQLAALRHHDYQKAYSYTSKAFKENTSFDQFVNFVHTFPSLDNNKDSTFTSRDIDSTTGVGTISGTLEANDGTIVSVTYQLVKENDVWKIINIDVKTTDAGAHQSDTENTEGVE